MPSVRGGGTIGTRTAKHCPGCEAWLRRFYRTYRQLNQPPKTGPKVYRAGRLDGRPGQSAD